MEEETCQDKNTELTQDENVNKVIKRFKQRSAFGFNKYGTTTERTDIDLIGWLTHLQEELMDATIYVERVKGELKKNRNRGGKV